MTVCAYRCQKCQTPSSWSRGDCKVPGIGAGNELGSSGGALCACLTTKPSQDEIL